ncbi:hypothetical protein J3T78_04780 [Staphylococcus nepalensis]|uniref:Uncharacterized protein n=1 Tax=Staphylococcus nepalensis TaxID=214473 RepID=A0ABS3L0B9_9STAP|nr:hypothetical protein [Staphylococcus nepalensis]MBO1213757.1 hypothetical protein [Staphylococcus nepalensis]MBO1215021.1 hypothetical protein [Staphylococcus nepalensis]MBO1226977.1 hypothetical protein [Staphylococcus nepalensis]MBO1234091.1 hypothetical protein [Staphylococcus nepalensis]MBO1237023.1 hypothetical protein [Staphylococcus nepalensis]
MIKFDKNINFPSLEDKLNFYRRESEEWINLHELNKKENEKISFKINTDLPSGMISIDELVDFSRSIQTVFKNIVNTKALETGLKLSQGEIKKNSTLIISDVRSGSFEIDLQQQKLGTFTNVLNENFEMQLQETKQPSLNDLVGVFQELHEEKLLELASNYNYKIFKNVKNLIEKSHKKNNSFDIKYSGDILKFTEKKLNKLTNKLKGFELDKLENTFEIKGKIIAVNHAEFYIIVKKQGTDENIKIVIQDKGFKNKEILSNQNVNIYVTQLEEMVGNEVVKTELVLNSLEQLIGTEN